MFMSCINLSKTSLHSSLGVREGIRGFDYCIRVHPFHFPGPLVPISMFNSCGGGHSQYLRGPEIINDRPSCLADLKAIANIHHLPPPSNTLYVPHSEPIPH